MASGSEQVHHPVFARMFDRLSRQAEKSGQGDHRRELLAGLTGRVLEVGAGNGLNFAHYPAGVVEVIAVEPERYLRERAREAAARAPVAVRVENALADRLPAEDATMDAAVVSLVLCSVASQERALGELHRVLAPGGELRFYEHVLAKSPRFARFQRAVDVVWPRIAGGCHVTRDTPAAIERAGFEIERIRRFPFRPSVLIAPATPHVLGVARRA